MVNKRIVLGILMIAFVGIAAAGTWANFVDSATDTGTLKAGTINIDLLRPNGQAGFSMDKLIPDSTTDHITFHRCWFNGNYFVTVMNTGDIPASLFISDVLTSTGSTIADHVDLYYSTTENGAPIAITPTSTDTGLNVGANGAQTVWLWYSYENVDSTIQNEEMGDTVNAVVNFELKNPDTTAAGDGI